MDGYLAVVPLSEIKQEIKKSPEAYHKFHQVVARYSLDTFLFNLNGQPYNNAVKHDFQIPVSKKLRDFYIKNPILKAFLNSVDKKDERAIFN